LLSDLDLMRLHLEAEFTHDAGGDLVSTNEPAATPAPRFFLGQTVVGIIRRYRHDVSETYRQSLEAAIAAELESSMTTIDRALDPTPFERVLSRGAPIENTSVGLAFRFPSAVPATHNARILRDPADARLLHPSLAAWSPDIQSSQPLAALILDGTAVAVCASVRITPRAHEAGVETAMPFRRRGYAIVVVAAWAAAVRELGAEPIYSTTWQNTASRAVASSLGLVSIGRDLHIT
jgi:ABC-type amino acid transport substrate-binding protein